MGESSSSVEPRKRLERKRRRASPRIKSGEAGCSTPAKVRSSPSTFLLALAAGVALWAALPPLQWSLLVWLAPIPWLILVAMPTLPGRRPYWALWGASSLHWLLVLQGIRLPFWALYFGWAALSLYLAIYLPLFVALTRVAVHRGRWPMWFASPVVWVGLEYARGHIATGFSGSLLGHALVGWVPLIQISDLFGAYGVSFLVMLVAACGTEMVLRWRRGAIAWVPGLAATTALALTVVYGAWRLQSVESDESPRVRVALLQGTFDTVFEYNPRRNEEIFEQYLRLATVAAHEHPDLDLILWPESTFTENNPHWLLGDNPTAPADLGGRTLDDYRRLVQRRAELFHEKSAFVAQSIHPESEVRRIRQMVGTETVDLTVEPARRYNSALFLDPQGAVVGRYDKIHRVMFGEYIPLGDWFPVIYQFSPMSGGLTSGDGPAVFEVAGLRFAPSICFESLVPHFVGRKLRKLERTGQPADVLVNLTHDGWFWGSSILDLHLACAVFRAVEHRRPMLAAANPGLTAWIDGDGRVRQSLERHEESYLIAEVSRDSRSSFYRRWGDLLAGVCLVFCVLWGVRGVGGPLGNSGPGQPRPV
jgi:apolipoprotein N-acyltransferase